MEYDHSSDKMERIMQIIRCNKKGSHMETAEKFRIFKETMKNFQLKQKYKVQPNNIFETILQGESL
jgi:hypothetical protein